MDPNAIGGLPKDLLSFLWISLSALVFTVLAIFLLMRFFGKKKEEASPLTLEVNECRNELKKMGQEFAKLWETLELLKKSGIVPETAEAKTNDLPVSSLPLQERITALYNQAATGNWEKAFASLTIERVVVPDLAAMEEKVKYQALSLEAHPSGELILISGEGVDFLVPLPGISMASAPKLFKNFFNLPQSGSGKVEALLAPALVKFDRGAGKCQVLKPGELKFKDESYTPAPQEAQPDQGFQLREISWVKERIKSLETQLNQLETQIIQLNSRLAEIKTAPATEPVKTIEPTPANPPASPGAIQPVIASNKLEAPPTPLELSSMPAWISRVMDIYNQEKGAKAQLKEKLLSRIHDLLPELAVREAAWEEAGYHRIEFIDITDRDNIRTYLPVNLELNYKEAAGQRFTAKFLQHYYNPPSSEAFKAFIDRLELPVILQKDEISLKGRIKYREERI